MNSHHHCCDECHDWGPEPWEIELADAVIRELGLTHYCRECGGWGPMDD